MSSKDKTREKLLGSMRKTKAGTGVGSGEPKQSSAPMPVGRQKPAAAKPALQKKVARHTEKGPKAQSDGYQSGRRVWPD